MTRALIACAALAMWVVGGAATHAGPVPDDTARPAASSASAPTQTTGRYKVQGDDCIWDAKDSGPNQCTPQTAGRFKKQGDDCVWDGSDRGPDQCTPPKGRWKTEGNRCVWNPNDSGPNQCNPRKPKS